MRRLVRPHAPAGRVRSALPLLLVAAGLLIPSSGWLAALGVDPLTPILIQGAWLFRLALIFVGVYGAVGVHLDFWRPSSTRVRPAAPDPRSRWVFAVLLVSAAALRLYRLDGGLWIDEVSTLVNYAREPFGRIVTTYDSQNQHLLYSLLAHASFRLFGESAWALRLPAALFGVGGVWALYLLGTEVADRREALLGSALLAFSYQHVWFSQSARGYTGLLMFALLSTLFFVQSLRRGSRRRWLAYAATTALGVFTHQTMLFIAAGQFVVYLVALRWPVTKTADVWWAPVLSGFVPAALLTFLFYALVLPQFPQTTATDVSNVQTWLSPLWTLREIVLGLHLGATLGIGIAAGVIVLLLGIRGYLPTEPAIPLLLVVPAVVGASVMIGFHHPVWPRFFFFIAGFGVLVVVRGLSAAAGIAGHMLRWTPARTAVAATLFTLLAIVADARSLQYVYRPKQDFVGAREFVNASRQPGDVVVTLGVATASFRSYFEPHWQSAETPAELNALRAGSGHAWVVYTLPIEMESDHADVLELVKRDFTLVREFDGSLNGGTIYVYRADGLAKSRDALISDRRGH